MSGLTCGKEERVSQTKKPAERWASGAGNMPRTIRLGEGEDYGERQLTGP